MRHKFVGMVAVLGLLFAVSAVSAQDEPPRGPVTNLLIQLANAIQGDETSETTVTIPQQGSSFAAPLLYNGISTGRTVDGGFILGDAQAPVTIIAFEDFTCPHCQTYESTVEQFIADHVATGQAQFEYRFFPIVHPEYAQLTAQLAECADTLRSGLFWQARAALFELGGTQGFDDNITDELAQRLELDSDELADCAATATQYRTDAALAQQLGIQGTPGIMVRYGDNAPEAIVYNGQTYNRGGVPIEVLAAAVSRSENEVIETLQFTSGEWGIASAVDSLGCPVDSLTQTTGPIAEFYAAAGSSDIPSGTTLFARLYHNGQPIEDSEQITADRDYEVTCFWFLFEDTTAKGSFAVGEYRAELIVNGNIADTAAFNIE